MNEELIRLLVVGVAGLGVAFMVIAALGINVLPDIYTRMHAAGKAATLGVSGVLLATGIYFWDASQLPRMVALILLFFITGPIATTTMARATYRTQRRFERLILRHDDLADARQD